MVKKRVRRAEPEISVRTLLEAMQSVGTFLSEMRDDHESDAQQWGVLVLLRQLGVAELNEDGDDWVLTSEARSKLAKVFAALDGVSLIAETGVLAD